MQKPYLITAVLWLFLTQPVFSQNQQQYPRITGYASVMHPIVTINKDHTTVNFDDYYQFSQKNRFNNFENCNDSIDVTGSNPKKLQL